MMTSATRSSGPAEPRPEPTRPMVAELITPAEAGWGPPNAPGGTTSEGSPGRILGYLKHHWVLITFLGAVLAAGFGFAAWNVIPAKYTTYSLVRVSLHPQEVAFQTEETPSRNDFNTYLKTQAQLIKSQFVLTAALRDAEVANLPMLKEQIDPVRFLEEELEVEYQEGSEIIKISLAGEDSTQIAKIVNAVQDAYFREIVEVEQRRKADRLKNLKDVQADMEKILKKNYDALLQTEEPLVVTDEGEVKRANQLALGQLAKLRDRLFQTDAEIASLTRKVKAIQGKLSVPPPEPTDSDIQESVKSDPNYAAAQRDINAQIESVKKRLDYLLSITSDPNHPQLVKLNENLIALEKQRAELEQQKYDEVRAKVRNHENFHIQQELEAAKAELADQETIREMTAGAIEQYEESIQSEKVKAESMQPLDSLKAEIQHREELIHRIIDKAHVLELEVKAPPRAQPLQAAAVPRKNEYKKQLLGTGFAGLLGFLVVGLGVVAYESRVRRVMSLSDVQRVAGGPVLGVIPTTGQASDEPAGGLSHGSWTTNRQLTEAVDKARTQAILQATEANARVMLITSPSEDEGKAFFTWKFTLSLARAGYRTLLIDADLREPSLHDYMGIPNDLGVCDVLRGEVELASAVQTLGEGLTFLPAGKWDDQVRQDLASGKIQALFAELRQHFDCVVVHSSPVLSVTDTVLIGRQTDMSILTVQRHLSRLPLVSRAQERLMGLNQPAYGVVYLGATQDEALI